MDYKRIPELKTVDLDLFRRRASEEVRITVAGLQILLHPPLHRLEKRKPRYLIDSRVSFVCLVGRTRFELVTNGLKVHKNQNLPVLNGVDTINLNQQLTILLKLSTVDLHIGIFVEFA